MQHRLARRPLRLLATIPLLIAAATTDAAEQRVTPSWFPPVYQQSLRAPLPASVQYAHGVIPDTVPKQSIDPNASGWLGSYNVNGPTTTAQHPFFQSLGTNGRACVTCHQPPSGMSVSVGNIRMRYLTTGGKDPVFAPVDGANCPSAVAAVKSRPSPRGGLLGRGPLLNPGVDPIDSPANAYSLLLKRGLFRIFLPWPPKAADGSNITPEFTLEVLNDPTKCLKDTVYGLNSPIPMVSIYRRPLMSSNLKFVTTLGTLFPPIDPLTGLPQPIDPFTGEAESGNIMWDGREPTLQSQVIDATLGHAQALNPPTDAQVAQIVAFEMQFFSAQSYDRQALDLTANGAFGGPVNLAGRDPGLFGGGTPFDEYDNWVSLPSNVPQFRQKQSIARGQAIFNERAFPITNVAGFNDVVGNSFNGTCSTCHNMSHAGSDILAQAQRDIGTTGIGPAAVAMPDLPLFRLTCTNGATTPFNGTTVVVRDPGKALITGKCTDIGKIKIPPLRALASRPPYFHDGSAPTLNALVDFYNRRFDIRLTDQEKIDLVNFLNAL